MDAEGNQIRAFFYALSGHLAVLGGLGGAVVCLVLCVIVQGRRAKSWSKFGLVASLMLAVASAAQLVRDHGPGGDGVVARLETADGVECFVHQSWNDWSEPYTISLYYRVQSGDRGWCYIEHEDHRWRDCELTHDASRNVVRATEHGKLRAELDVRERSFALFDRRGELTRTVPAPQGLRAPPP